MRIQSMTYGSDDRGNESANAPLKQSLLDLATLVKSLMLVAKKLLMF